MKMRLASHPHIKFLTANPLKIFFIILYLIFHYKTFWSVLHRSPSVLNNPFQGPKLNIFPACAMFWFNLSFGRGWSLSVCPFPSFYLIFLALQSSSTFIFFLFYLHWLTGFNSFFTQFPKGKIEWVRTRKKRGGETNQPTNHNPIILVRTFSSFHCLFSLKHPQLWVRVRMREKKKKERDLIIPFSS